MRHSKNSYLHEKCIEFKQDSRKLWQLVNKLIGRNNNKNDSIDCLRVDNILKHDPTSGLCDFFSNIGEKYASQIGDTDPDINHYINQIPQNSKSLFLAPTIPTEINDLIMKLPTKNSSGYDKISNNLLKKLSTAISAPLSIIFTKMAGGRDLPRMNEIG